MYASQSKRLCVREAPADDTRAQHLSSSSPSADTTTSGLMQQSTSSLASSTHSPALNPSSSSSATGSGSNIRRITKTSSSIGGGIASSNTRCVSRESTDCNHTNLSMTASATGSLPSNENESPIKSSTTTTTTNQTSPLIYSSHHDQSQITPWHHAPDGTSVSTQNPEGGHINDSEQQLIDRLANETLEEARLESILSIRNLITACNKKKVSLVNNPNFTKILRIIDDENHTSSEVKAQLALLLCSVAKGGEQNVRILNDSFVDDKIFYLILGSQDDALIEACLRCMRAIMSWPKVSRQCRLYDRYSCSDENNGIQHVIGYARQSHSHVVQECVADIFAATCNRRKDQALLFNSGALQCISELLESKSHRVILAALNWLSTVCFTNSDVSLEALNSQCPSGVMLQDKLVELMGKDQCIEFQFASARCFTRIYKAICQQKDLRRRHLEEDDSKVVLHVLPTLVRMVHKDKPVRLRSEAASTIASLIEGDSKLQEIASICDHLIESLANMLEFEMSYHRDEPLSLYSNFDTHWKAYISDRQSSRSVQLLDLSNVDFMKQMASKTDLKYSDCVHEMKLSAFQALAALASNQETIRKKIFQSCAIMQHLIISLSDTDTRTLKSVLICLLSLSRSVQQLRTNFVDPTVYNGLKSLLLTKSNDILNLVLMILCNITLDFSPGKPYFLNEEAIDIFCNLTHNTDPSLRLNSMWILMNMVYMLKELGLKFLILKKITPEYVLKILETEHDDELLLKTLGFLRNLLSYRPHIDEIMNNHGEQILQSLAKLLERPCSSMCKEQAICVLTNIADGIEAKAMIMNNRRILKYLANILCDDDAGNLRLAAICCITNLVHKDHEGSQSRQNEMISLGIQEKLKSMLNTMDPTLSDRVRTAYNQFLVGIDDKYVN